MLTEGDLVTSVNQSDKVRELQDKIASLRAQVRTSLPKSSNSGESVYYRKSSEGLFYKENTRLSHFCKKKNEFHFALKITCEKEAIFSKTKDRVERT